MQQDQQHRAISVLFNSAANDRGAIQQNRSVSYLKLTFIYIPSAKLRVKCLHNTTNQGKVYTNHVSKCGIVTSLLHVICIVQCTHDGLDQHLQ
jgi:hypothetical protein